MAPYAQIHFAPRQWHFCRQCHGLSLLQLTIASSIVSVTSSFVSVCQCHLHFKFCQCRSHCCSPAIWFWSLLWQSVSDYWQSVSDIEIRNRHFKKSFINMTVKSQFKLKTWNCQSVKVNDMRASRACQSRTAMAPNAKRRRQQSLADQQESDDECVAQLGRNVMQLRNEAATGFDQRLDLNTILCRDMMNPNSVSPSVRWPRTCKELLPNGLIELL